MPYARTYKKGYNKTYKKRTRKAMPYRQAKATKAIVRKELDKNIENKFVFNSASDVVATTLTSQTFASGAGGSPNIAQGTTRLTRIGNKIMIKRLTVKGKIVIPVGDTVSRVRIMIIRTVGSGYTPAMGDLVYYTSSTYSIQSPVNYAEKSGKFQVLYDKVFVLDEAVGESKNFYFSKNINKVKLYDDSGNDLKGEIHICYWTDEGTYPATVTWASYLSYEDA